MQTPRQFSLIRYELAEKMTWSKEMCWREDGEKRKQQVLDRAVGRADHSGQKHMAFFVDYQYGAWTHKRQQHVGVMSAVWNESHKLNECVAHSQKGLRLEMPRNISSHQQAVSIKERMVWERGLSVQRYSRKQLLDGRTQSIAKKSG